MTGIPVSRAIVWSSLSSPPAEEALTGINFIVE
jgi:hypothetical protein